MNLSEILSGTQWRRFRFDSMNRFCLKNKKPLGAGRPPKRPSVFTHLGNTVMGVNNLFKVIFYYNNYMRYHISQFEDHFSPNR